jgi:hypothetical protein
VGEERLNFRYHKEYRYYLDPPVLDPNIHIVNM